MGRDERAWEIGCLITAVRLHRVPFPSLAVPAGRLAGGQRVELMIGQGAGDTGLSRGGYGPSYSLIMIMAKLLMRFILDGLAGTLSTTTKGPNGHGDRLEGARQCKSIAPAKDANSEAAFQVFQVSRKRDSDV